MIELSKVTADLVNRIKSVAETNKHMDHREMNFFVEEYANEFGRAWAAAIVLATAEGATRVTLKFVEFHGVHVPGTIPKVQWHFTAESC